jgi:hypothetical protein
MAYPCRASALEKERRWSLRADELSWTAEDGRDATRLADVVEIRLQYTPTRFVADMHRCHIHLRNGRAWELRSHHFAGLAQFEDRSEAYRAFVSALVRRVATSQPHCRFVVGVGWLRWALNTVFLCGMLLVLAGVLLFMWTVVGWLVVVKILIILIFLPRAFRWIARNRPRNFDPQTVAAFLPAGDHPTHRA